MKVFSATRNTQGHRATDFFWAEEGEILRGNVGRCNNNTTQGGERCGCAESLIGAVSHKGTTTFEVRELPISPGELRLLLIGSFIESGFSRPDDDYLEEAVELHGQAEIFKVGTICEIANHVITERR